MSAKRQPPIIEYNVDELPPRVFWKVPVQLVRSDVGSFCEQLHALVIERQGASFYYPTVESQHTLCRYEWHKRHARDKFGLRLGVVINVGPENLSEIEAYVTLSTVIGNPGTRPELPKNVVTAAQRDVIEMLGEALRRRTSQDSIEWFVVRHVEMPYQHGFARRFESTDQHLTFLPTRILKDRNRRVSAVVIRVSAGSKELAKARAFGDLTIACALFTLANSQRYETAVMDWPRTRPNMEFVDSVKGIDENRLYPLRRHWPDPESMSPDISERCDWIWSGFNRLSEDERRFFLPALFAYYSAKTDKTDWSTLSVVGFTAALGALATGKKRKCEGSLTCSICGSLSFKHDIRSEVAAILELVSEICGITDKTRLDALRQMIQRVYREQRSAYVHAAQLRHQEYGQGSKIPVHLPTNDAPVQEFAQYAEDLLSISRTARWTLLAWLAEKTGTSLEHKKFGINTENVTASILNSAQISMPGGTTIRMSHATKKSN
jgi:hypothetical protein